MPYVRAASFATEAAALHAYLQTQEELYQNRKLDLSAFRFFLDQISHVAVLGQVPPDRLRERLNDILGAGTAIILPQEIRDAFMERRREMTGKGPWVEGHYRPGIPYRPRRRRP